MKKQMKALMGAVVLAAAVGIVVSAQAGVTITLRSGEVLSARLIDLGAAGLEVDVQGANRRIPMDQVAIVDFGGTPAVRQTWFTNMTGADHLVVFKNGDTLVTQWEDVGGTSPLILRIAGGRELSSADVARIYLVRPGGATSGTIGTTPSRGGAQADGSIAVMANAPWTDTGIAVRTGDYLRFEVGGEIRFGVNDGDTASADGNPAGRASATLRSVPVRSLPVGGLIGKVGTNGAPFSIGSAPEPIRMPAAGRLYLGINDLTFNDNSGFFRVIVTR
jgi:hypothetical protein